MDSAFGGAAAEQEAAAGVAMMYEYAVDMVCDKCSEAVHKALKGMAGVSSVTTNVKAQIVIVEGSMNPSAVLPLLEDVGRKVKLIGSGCSTAIEKGVFVVPASVGRPGENSAAVAEFKGEPSGHGAALGTVRFVGLAAGPPESPESGPWVHADVNIDGLAPDTECGVEVHEFGDLSKGADSTGPLFAFGVLGGSLRCTDDEGRLQFTAVLSGHHVWECIGRSVVLRLGLSQGEAVAAVVARSAGVGANPKMLCACDGTVIWDASALLPGGSGRARPAVPMSGWMDVAKGGVPWPAAKQA